VGHITITADKTTDTLTATKSAAISFDKTMVEVRLLVHDARNGKARWGLDRRTARWLRIQGVVRICARTHPLV